MVQDKTRNFRNPGKDCVTPIGKCSYTEKDILSFSGFNTIVYKRKILKRNQDTLASQNSYHVQNV